MSTSKLYSFRFDEIQLYVFPTRLADTPSPSWIFPPKGRLLC